MFNPFATKKDLETLNVAHVTDDVELAKKTAARLINKAMTRTLITTVACFGAVAGVAYVAKKFEERIHRRRNRLTLNSPSHGLWVYSRKIKMVHNSENEHRDIFEASGTFRILTAEGNVWMESTDRLRVEGYMTEGDTLQRMFYGPPVVQWRDEEK